LSFIVHRPPLFAGESLPNWVCQKTAAIAPAGLQSDLTATPISSHSRAQPDPRLPGNLRTAGGYEVRGVWLERWGNAITAGVLISIGVVVVTGVV
jgi:hypothetical protein